MKVKKSPQTDIKKCPRLQNLVPTSDFVVEVRIKYMVLLENATLVPPYSTTAKWEFDIYNIYYILTKL